MTTEEALAELGIDWPWGNKLSCPKHSDSDPSLHVYPGDRGFYCFSCAKGGDGWGLLAHFYDKSVPEIMRERGIKLGPRPRSRWEQLADIEARGHEARLAYHEEVMALWHPDRVRGLQAVDTTEERVTWAYGLDIYAKYYPEDKAPYLMENRVHDLEAFLASELTRERHLSEMAAA